MANTNGIVAKTRRRIAEAVAPNVQTPAPTAPATAAQATTRPSARMSAPAAPAPQQGRKNDGNGNKGRTTRVVTGNALEMIARIEQIIASHPRAAKSVKKFVTHELCAGEMLLVTTNYGTKYLLLATEETAESKNRIDKHPAAEHVNVLTNSTTHANGPEHCTLVRDFVEVGRALIYVVDNANPEKTSPVATIRHITPQRQQDGTKPSKPHGSGRGKKR